MNIDLEKVHPNMRRLVAENISLLTRAHELLTKLQSRGRFVLDLPGHARWFVSEDIYQSKHLLLDLQQLTVYLREAADGDDVSEYGNSLLWTGSSLMLSSDMSDSTRAVVGAFNKLIQPTPKMEDEEEWKLLQDPS